MVRSPVLLSLLASASAMRTAVNESAMMNDELFMDSSTSKYDYSGKSFTVELRGVKCQALDLGQYKNLAYSGGCHDSIVAEAKERTHRNCYLCDVTIEGHSRYSDSGYCSGSVKCSAAGRMTPESSCSTKTESKIRLGIVQGYNAHREQRESYPDTACLPCPKECKYCIFEHGVTTRDFKCVIRPSGENGGVCKRPEGYDCGECTKRDCMRKWSWVPFLGHMPPGCSTDDWKAYCHFQKTYEYGNDDWNEERSATLTLKPLAKTKGEGAPSSMQFLKDVPTEVSPRPTRNWKVSFYGIKCGELDPKPFTKLEESHFAGCLSGAREKGSNLVSTANCGLCDMHLELKEEDGSCTHSVHCSAHLKPKEACFLEQGQLGVTENLNDNSENRLARRDSMCLPCPNECNTNPYCTRIPPNRERNRKMGWRQFTCKMKSTGNTDTGLKVTVPARNRCDPPKNRQCEGFGPFKPSNCDKKDYGMVCDMEDTYNNGAFPGNEIRDYTVTVELSPTSKYALPSAFDTIPWE